MILGFEASNDSAHLLLGFPERVFEKTMRGKRRLGAIFGHLGSYHAPEKFVVIHIQGEFSYSLPLVWVDFCQEHIRNPFRDQRVNVLKMVSDFRQKNCCSGKALLAINDIK